jgi:hypothetical protein
LAGYFGNTQSTLFNNLPKENEALQARADSSVVNMMMLGLDARYSIGGLELRGQYIVNSVSNSAAYNGFTGKDLGSRLNGWYAEAAYNLLHKTSHSATPLILFARLEKYNLHAATENGMVKNKAYNMTEITTGLGFKISEGAVIKTDIQLTRQEGVKKFGSSFNAGIGVNF